jgi:hypothetical protein
VSNHEKLIFWHIAKKSRREVFFNLIVEGGVDMCKKLSIFCLMLAAVAALSLPALASPITEANPLKADFIEPSTATVQAGWQGWAAGYGWTSPISKTFDMGGTPFDWPTAELSTVRKAVSPYPNITGASRSRNGGMAFVAGTGEYATNGKGLGTTYLKLALTNLTAQTNHVILLWSWEKTGVWSNATDNPNARFGFWGTTNPLTWLNANGGSGLNGEPNGYYPKVGPMPITESNMPAALFATGQRISMQAPDPGADWIIGDVHYAKLVVNSGGTLGEHNGAITVYGWMDSTSLGGSMHMPIEGFMVIPEPATVALLGLGGLAMMRRRKRA